MIQRIVRSIRLWWANLMVDSIPRDPDKYFGEH